MKMENVRRCLVREARRIAKTEKGTRFSHVNGVSRANKLKSGEYEIGFEVVFIVEKC